MKIRDLKFSTALILLSLLMAAGYGCFLAFALNRTWYKITSYTVLWLIVYGSLVKFFREHCRK